MKTNKTKHIFIVLIITFLHISSANGQISDYNYSVKNRWTVKASISSYKTAFEDWTKVLVGDFFHSQVNRKMINFKIEANYGINKFIEIGIFTGFQHYEYYETFIENDSSGSSLGILGIEESFSPLFGVNINFHILPFFVKVQNCNWDLYLTTKYGGCYLPHKEIDYPDYSFSKYRHEYGIGVGIGYYIKNIIGIFAEGSIGQFSFFPQWMDSNFSFRIGIAAKL